MRIVETSAAGDGGGRCLSGTRVSMLLPRCAKFVRCCLSSPTGLMAAADRLEGDMADAGTLACVCCAA
eukprot:5735221-Pleurochrysis_carterae.AAC.1